ARAGCRPADARGAMKLRRRLRRLERRATGGGPAEAVGPDLFARIRQQAAYLAGEGPRPSDPLCSPWFDRAEWASRLRIGRCLDERFRGRLQPGEYLADMDAEERRYVDGVAGVFASDQALPEEDDVAHQLGERRS